MTNETVTLKIALLCNAAHQRILTPWLRVYISGLPERFSMSALPEADLIFISAGSLHPRELDLTRLAASRCWIHPGRPEFLELNQITALADPRGQRNHGSGSDFTLSEPLNERELRAIIVRSYQFKSKSAKHEFVPRFWRNDTVRPINPEKLNGPLEQVLTEVMRQNRTFIISSGASKLYIIPRLRKVARRRSTDGRADPFARPDHPVRASRPQRDTSETLSRRQLEMLDLPIYLWQLAQLRAAEQRNEAADPVIRFRLCGWPPPSILNAFPWTIPIAANWLSGWITEAQLVEQLGRGQADSVRCFLRFAQIANLIDAASTDQLGGYKDADLSNTDFMILERHVPRPRL